MKSFLYQGSGGTIGDLLLSSHIMYHMYTKKNKVSVAIPNNLHEELKYLYTRHTFLDDIIEIDQGTFTDVNKFIEYAIHNNFEPIIYLDENYIWLLHDIIFHPLFKWFNLIESPILNFKQYVGFHITSSTNWDRYPIPYIKSWIESVLNVNLRPCFIGTKKDEELILKLYPDIKSWYSFDEQYWRFGKDSILQTIANISDMYSMIVFSSWSTYAAIFQGIPAVEMWNDKQWQFYSPIVNRMLGGPVHYVPASYKEPPSPFILTEILPGLKRRCQSVHFRQASLINC